METTIRIFSDAGHAWGKVRRDELETLGIADKITSFSYQYGDYVYLEEDCDLGTYIAAKEKLGFKVKFLELSNVTKSRIRTFEHYTR